MPTRDVELTKHQEEVIDILVSSGRYRDASEVLREALRLLEQREAENAAKLRALREAARLGFEAIEQGAYQEFANAGSLLDYLRDLSEQVIGKTRK